MIAVIATLLAKPEHADEVAKALADAAVLVRSDAEPGCSIYQPSRSLENPCLFKVLEVYDSQEAIVAHRETPHFQPLKAAFATMLAEPPSVERLDAYC